MSARHDAEQIVQSGMRMAAVFAACRSAEETHKLASQAAGEAADKVRETADVLRLLIAARRAELECEPHGSEGGPH